MRPWRYDDAARALDDELEAMPKVSHEPVEAPGSSQGGLERIRDGQTAFAGLEAVKAAAAASVPQALLEHETSRALNTVLRNKQAAVQRFLDNKEEG